MFIGLLTNIALKNVIVYSGITQTRVNDPLFSDPVIRRGPEK
jgi:hypothetical protein